MQLLKYQQKFLDSSAKIKVLRKSRRIGATFTVALDTCFMASRSNNPIDVFVSSADMLASKEFIRYVQAFAKKLDKASRLLGDIVLEDEKDITALAVEFITKKRVMALSSSPRSFRSKGGGVILDEFAFHDNQREMWKASTPVIRWGGTIQVLSSVAGEVAFFEELCVMAKEKSSTSDWHFQQTTIIDAIDDGIVDKILNKKATQKDRDNFLQGIRDECISEETFLQEYMCVPASSEGEYWLPFEIITNCESKQIKCDGSSYSGGKTVIGHDVALRGDNSVFVVFEIMGDVAHLVDLKIMHNQKFLEQEQVLRDLVKTYNPYRIYIDQTGMGEKVVEDYSRIFRSSRVQGILFNLASKMEMAINAKQLFEDKRIRLPFANELIRSDLRRIKREVGISNVPKFTVEKATSKASGHGDIAWSMFLALLGLKRGYQPLNYESVGTNMLRGKSLW